MGTTLPARSLDELQTDRLRSNPVVVAAPRDETRETENNGYPSTSSFRLKRNIHFHRSETAALRTHVTVPPAEEYFKAIRNWEGVVENVGRARFTATMREMGNPQDRGDEIFEFDMDDVDLGDRDLLTPGAIFYFTLGYKIDSHQTRYKGTRMMFRRMPQWNDRDMERIETRTEKLLRSLQSQPNE